MKYLITTFGCQSNIADSEKTAKVLESTGYKKASDLKDLLSAKEPVLIFNTCSVRQKAEDRVFGLNKKLQDLKIKSAKRRIKLKIILTGCMMHYSESELKKRLPYFDYFVDMKNIDNLPKLLGAEKTLNVTIGKRSQSSGHILDYDKELLLKKTVKTSVLIPISNGCNNFCTYCIVPYARGREISRPVEEILNDVNLAVKPPNGAKEVWLLGQTVNGYKEKEIKFFDLLRLVNNISGDFWIRFTSPHPKDFSDDLIKAMAECEKFAHYINLPVQSGNNAVLKRMGRPYTVGHYKKLIKKIRRAMPDIAISTDIIVGFPGETRKQFEDTKKLFEEIKFDMAFISEYSPRPKTTAAKMFEDDVSHKEKEARKDELNEILKKTALENNQKLVGQTVKVLNNRTAGNKLVKIIGKSASWRIKDEFINIKITKAEAWKLEGKVA